MSATADFYLFPTAILKWNKHYNKREMPWKGEKDPYKIWLSEIILQQTRVEQGLDYYNRFVKKFPTVQKLAKAHETTIFKLWEGLGYYSRCKNLITTAKFIATELDGRFPDKYEDIINLKGIGPYTAAAIASFSFNLPHAVVDGNVYRVLSRYFGIDTPIDSNEGKKYFNQLAHSLLDKKNPATYNQAMMDFGAVVCKPKLPNCGDCILKKNCSAFNNNNIGLFPVKSKAISKKNRWFYFVIIAAGNSFYVTKRGAGDIWENLYQFVLIEHHEKMALLNIEQHPEMKKLFNKTPFRITNISEQYKQQLTHQTIYGQFIHVSINKQIAVKNHHPVGLTALKKLPFPKFITNYLKDKNVSLNLI